MTVLIFIFIAVFAFALGFLLSSIKKTPTKISKEIAEKEDKDIMRINKEYENFLNYDGTQQFYRRKNNMENVDLKENALPQAKNNALKEIFVPIKYNKEVINLTLQQASELAQKGKKFEAVSGELEDLKELAELKGQSLSQFVASLKAERSIKRQAELTEKCGGDEQLAQHIIELESGKKGTETAGFEELKVFFPQFDSPEDLPEEVLQSASLKGSLLLDEYLRYMLKEKMLSKEIENNQKIAEKNSIGSQLNRSRALNPEAAEFLKGLWR